MSWHDTNKERIMLAEVILDKDPEHYSFKRTTGEGGGIYTFVPMNLGIYNDSVRTRLIDGKEFPDEQSMINAFLEAKDDAW